MMVYALWTRQAVEELILNRFGIKLAVRTMAAASPSDAACRRLLACWSRACRRAQEHVWPSAYDARKAKYRCQTM